MTIGAVCKNASIMPARPNICETCGLVSKARSGARLWVLAYSTPAESRAIRELDQHTEWTAEAIAGENTPSHKNWFPARWGFRESYRLF
jgi:hypothetical protein